MSRIVTMTAMLGLLLVGATAGRAAEKRVGDAYPLSTCPVTGEKLGAMGDPVVLVHEGREIRFCCRGCIGKFKKDPAKYLKAVDAKIVEEQKDAYPLKTCVISGEELGGEMKPIDVVVGSRLVRLCCKGCVRDVRKDPAGTLRKLDKAILAQQKKDYPLKTCVITGRKLDAMGGPVDYVHANRLVRFCCRGCIARFERDPRAAFAKIDAASKAVERPTTAEKPEEGSRDEHGKHGEHHDDD